MWPLTGREIREALGADVATDADEEIFDGVGDLFFALTVNGRDGHRDVAEYFRDGGRLAIVARAWSAIDGVSERRLLRVEEPFDAFKKLAAFMRARFSFPVIAIAGANGKTTTKDMTRAVLSGGNHRVSATEGTENGHLGVPLTLLSRAHSRKNPPDALVIEIGIDAIGAMRGHAEMARPDFVVITSLGEEHLRGLRDEDTASREELELFALSPRAKRILNASSDERLARLIAEQREGDVTVVDAADPAMVARGRIVQYSIGAFDGSGRDLVIGDRVIRVPLPGEHHARLAALAIAVALALGRSTDDIEDGWRTFAPSRGRAEIVRLERDVVLIDDTFNASPASMRAAIAIAREACFGNRPKALLLGDMLDLGDATPSIHARLADDLRDLRGAHVRLYGDAMRSLLDALGTDHALASLTHLATRADPIDLLDGRWASLEGALVIVKGSRGMHLERVTDALRRVYGETRPLPDRPGFAGDFFTVGVTGTNGKTTTTTWLAACLAQKKAPVARASTLGYFVGDERLDHALDFDGFVAALGAAHARGARIAALEVTSEALQHGFAKIWPFHIGVFTNLTHDHLDVHTSPEHYLASKAQLFMSLAPNGVAIFNACDGASALLREVCPASVTTYAYGVASRGEPEGDVDLFASSIRFDGEHSHVTLERSERLRDFPSELVIRAVGDVFVENALAAALGAFAAGVAPVDIARALADVAPPRGRFEIVATSPRVVIDYAHTPDALARTIAAAREITHGNVIVVFGAGGDRDKLKRAPMGRAAAAADVVIVTSDNPRTENPNAIAADIVAGLASHARTTIELDRATAIARAIADAHEDDTILVCGKGHETDQIIGTTRKSFSDHAIAIAACTKRQRK